MKTLINLSVLILFLFLAPGTVAAVDQAILDTSDLPELLPQPLAEDPLDVTIHRLSNGMTVFISPSHEVPRFNAWIVVRSGSRVDPPNSTGLAHYLEHMLFKGTDRFGTTDFESEKPHLDRIADLYDKLRKGDELPDNLQTADEEERRAAIFKQIDEETQASAVYAIPNELDQIYATMGMRGINAFTWHDMTVYIADVPRNRLLAWCTLEAERLLSPQFRLFYPELEAVYEEKNMSLDRSGERVDDALNLALYPDHPYGTQPTIGLVEHLKTPAFGDMVEFFDRWYVPNNMAICLAGDVVPEDVLPVLEDAFGGLKPKALASPAPSSFVPIPARQEIVIEAEGENSVTMGWQTVGINHSDYAALTVMDWLTANSKSGIIDTELLLTQKLPRAFSSPQVYREAGHWKMYGQAKEGQTLEEVEGLLLEVTELLKRGQFTQEDIDAVVLQSQMSEMTELESNGSRVGKMAESFWNHTPWKEQARLSSRLKEVTRADILRVANQYITDKYVAVHRKRGEYSPPKVEAPSITPVPIDPSKKSGFATELEAIPTEDLSPVWYKEGKHYKRKDLPTGNLIAVENAMNSLFSVSYEFEIGRRELPLLPLALDLLEQSGTSIMSAAEMQRAQWGSGTSIGFGPGVNTTTISVSGIDERMEDSMELLNLWFNDPNLSEETLVKLVENRISQRNDSMQEPRQVSQALTAYAYQGEQSANLIVASNDELKAATVSDLIALIRDLPKYKHKTNYFGPRSAKDAAKVIDFGTGEKETSGVPPIVYRSTGGETKIFFTPKETAQTSIGILFPKDPFPKDEMHRANLYNNYVGGGMGGLIFQEVREARGLAYSARASHRSGGQPDDQSAVHGFVGTQADKTIDALTVMLDLLRNLPDQPERVTKAKAQIDQRYRATRPSPRNTANIIRGWDRMGYDDDPRPTNWKAGAKLDSQDLLEFARQFASGDLIIAITGDPARIDMEALKTIGEITEVGIEDIFGY